MKETIRGILNEVIDILDEVYDWEENAGLRNDVVIALEEIQDSLEELIRKM